MRTIFWWTYFLSFLSNNTIRFAISLAFLLFISYCCEGRKNFLSMSHVSQKAHFLNNFSRRCYKYIKREEKKLFAEYVFFLSLLLFKLKTVLNIKQCGASSLILNAVFQFLSTFSILKIQHLAVE